MTITTKKTATAFCAAGSVTLMIWGSDISVLSYLTNKGHDDIGAWSQRDVFAQLVEAASKELLA